ncbi:MAG TPA: TGS domain-containing protein, partial [Acidobacteriaceae bacterium]|nr:TGS domain-containing protein [Acidobacteriaceae bacterium]
MSDSSQIQIHLPDGSIKQLPPGSTAHDVAMSISPRLAAAAIVARVRPVNASHSARIEPLSGPVPGDEKSAPGERSMYAAPDASAERLVDLRAPLTEDVHLQLLTEKDADALQVVRHSAAHVMATAVLELFPETKLGHGPATDAGYFYDFYRPTPFTTDDLSSIELKMAEVVDRDEPFVREYEPREQGLADYHAEGDF